MHDSAFRAALAAIAATTLVGVPVYYGQAVLVPTFPALFIALLGIDSVSEAFRSFVETYRYRLTYIRKAAPGGAPPEVQAYQAMQPFLAVANTSIGPGFAGVARASEGPVISYEVPFAADEPLAAINVDYTFHVSRLVGDDA